MPCQQSLGRDNGGDLVQHLPSQHLGLSGSSPALMVIEAQSPIAELLAKDPGLLAKVVNDLQLALVHPPGNGDQQKAEWSKTLWGFKAHYRDRRAAVPNHHIFMQIQFSGHTGNPVMPVAVVPAWRPKHAN